MRLPACLIALISLVVTSTDTWAVQVFPWFPDTAGVTIRYVNPSGSATPVDGLSYEKGFRSLDDALDSSVNTVLGTNASVELRLAGRHVYKPTRHHYLPLTPASPRTATFGLHPDIYKITGGWTGLEPSGAQFGSGSASILSGDIGVPNDPTDNCFHVLVPFPNNAATPQWIKDVVIQGGYADGPATHGIGGGILNYGGRLRLAEVVVQDCHAQYGGACASIEVAGGPDSELHVRRAQFITSTAAIDGGGLYLRHSGSFRFVNCVVRNNTASQRGGGIMMEERVHDCFFVNPLIHDNLAEFAGGGVYAADPTGLNSGFWIINGTIAYNSGGDNGGAGVYIEYDSSNSGPANRLIGNTIIYSNPPSANNDNLFLEPAPFGLHELDVSNCFIGESAFSFGTLRSGLSGVGGQPHIDAALYGYTPGWVNPAGRVFRLLSTSVCINNGSDLLLRPDFVDLDFDLVHPQSNGASEETPVDLYEGGLPSFIHAAPRQVTVAGTGFTPVSIGEDGGQVFGHICDIGAYEYRL
jgi:hypothetical protein